MTWTIVLKNQDHALSDAAEYKAISDEEPYGDNSDQNYNYVLSSDESQQWEHT